MCVPFFSLLLYIPLSFFSLEENSLSTWVSYVLEQALKQRTSSLYLACHWWARGNIHKLLAYIQFKIKKAIVVPVENYLSPTILFSRKKEHLLLIAF